MSAEIVGFGPSMVDICAPLDEARYQKCHQILGTTPGEWRLIEDSSEVDQLLQHIGVDNVGALDSGVSAPQADQPSMAAGSSTLGMIGALPPDLRTNSTLVTTLAVQGNELDTLSSYFAAKVNEYGIGHDVTLVDGRNPVGFVLYHRDDAQNPEKTLAMYPGVAQQLAEYDAIAEHNPALLLVDTYELKSGELSRLLDKLITSGKYRIALSLGSHTLLADGLQNQVRDYIDGGRIDILCGNELEYGTLYPELGEDQMKWHNFGDHPVGNTVGYALLTRGAEGLEALWNNSHIKTPAYQVPRGGIINTSGAGDTAMGVFCGGVIEGKSGQDTLEKAAFYASSVLLRSSSMIIARH